MQAQQKQDNQKFTTLKWHCLNPMAEVFSMPPQKLTSISERFAAMAPKKQVTPTKPTKPSPARMYVELQQHAANLAVEGFIASDPNFAASLKHLNGERTRHIVLPHTLEVSKFAASVARIIGDDRRSARILEGRVAAAVCERLAAQCAVPVEGIAARTRFMTGSEMRCKHGSKPPKGHNCSDACRQLVDPAYHGQPHFIVNLRWRSH